MPPLQAGSSTLAARLKRTFCVLIQPDISCATDILSLHACLDWKERLTCTPTTHQMVTTTATKGSSIRLVALASLIGTTIEWYDFFLYGTAAALVFNRLFFPTFDPRLGTLAAFGTYSVGFLVRPVGGIIIGHYGDRVGRKSMLILTLILMDIATFSIGLMPTYAQIGPWAAPLSD
jgi:hypothetical protein